MVKMLKISTLEGAEAMVAAREQLRASTFYNSIAIHNETGSLVKVLPSGMPLENCNDNLALDGTTPRPARCRTMQRFQVLIVEDEILVALDLEVVLLSAGCDICGMAASETQALSIAKIIAPDFAVVDVDLSPGDGRIVARELVANHHTTVLFTTARAGNLSELAETGAHGLLRKPYDPAHVHPSLLAIAEIREGRIPEVIPPSLVSLRASL